MKRLWIILLVGLLAAAVAAPAAAAKAKPAPPEHPAGLSCAEAVIYYGATHQVITWAPTDGGQLAVTLTKAAPLVCIDVTNAAAGSFTIQVTDPGVARTLTANLRDSHPGDFCPSCNTTSIDLTATRTLTFAGVPAATVNACGLEYSEGVLDEYGNLVDQISTQTGEPDPLALSISDSPTRATVQLTVTYNAG